MTVPWASASLGDGSIAAVEAIEGAVTVDLIATFEPELMCCPKTDAIDRLLADPNYAQFDHLPVRSKDRIVGLLPLGEFRAAPIDPLRLTAEGAMHSLDQSILITSGSSVLRYIEEATASPCRLVIRDTRIAGIVTISDLQKLAVRPALFVLVTHLELLMAAAIRAHFRERPDEDWLKKLGDRRPGVEQNWQKLKASGLEIDLIAATQFADKRQILAKSELLQCSRTQAKREFEAIENLRNGLAHANNYASTKESAQKTIAAVKLARKWIALLQEVVGQQQGADLGKTIDEPRK
jgi:CBS domain-containing protein